MLMRAVGAARDMTAKCRGSTALNRTHDFELVQADVSHCRATDRPNMGIGGITRGFAMAPP
jgi:hypothetical protein